MFKTGRPEEKKQTRQAQFPLLGSFCPDAGLGFSHIQDCCSFFPGLLCSDDTIRLLLVAYYAVRFIPFPSCFVQIDFPLADSVS
jgi:hypothetical protein